jgi:hypothetical protein
VRDTVSYGEPERLELALDQAVHRFLPARLAARESFQGSGVLLPRKKKGCRVGPVRARAARPARSRSCIRRSNWRGCAVRSSTFRQVISSKGARQIVLGQIELVTLDAGTAQPFGHLA